MAVARPGTIELSGQLDFVNSGYHYVDWWTHKVHGLHQNDFVMAAKTDKLLVPQSS